MQGPQGKWVELAGIIALIIHAFRFLFFIHYFLFILYMRFAASVFVLWLFLSILGSGRFSLSFRQQIKNVLFAFLCVFTKLIFKSEMTPKLRLFATSGSLIALFVSEITSSIFL